ncbi:tetratricopeptide repeat protein [Candidatus Synechococcus calcipolaris G9]|uniref:Tetratricopeptide repeat protein n=1 Tax=Candidatus Synechococcus calcipolaris G9 TaxID=1497997 RepID=A0ABT6F190_9SYNE|nr:tetratricopeptide repeat protein [Candidatus Synechococcus calcipolaris]MDG2991623.1 tetratricopeptide repeat protein [Candidatus Synechococcus calcipolaris G9]
MALYHDPSTTMTSPEELFHQGQQAFERGNYAAAIQCLNQAAALSQGNIKLAGEIKTWLVTAYEAAGNHDAAIALCRQLQTYPDSEIRKQNRRLLAILNAPQLQRRPEWLSQIPDLETVTDTKGVFLGDRPSQAAPRKPSAQSKTDLMPLTPENPENPASTFSFSIFIWGTLGILGVGLILVAVWPLG